MCVSVLHQRGASPHDRVVRHSTKISGLGS
jgi:hypothetical protein